jgi:hypothetical protein
VIYRGRLFSAFLLLVRTVLCVNAPSAHAETLTVSVSGQFGSEVTTDQLAAPDASWALSFEVDSSPAASNSDALGFDAPFSDFSYMLNGSAVAVSPGEIRFFTSADGGLFTVFFGPETGFNNGMPIPEFSLSGGQAFSGTTAGPTITAGSYPVADVIYSDALNFDDEGASGTVTIKGTSSTVPEPSSLWLFLAAAALTFLSRFRARAKRRVSSTPRRAKSSPGKVPPLASEWSGAIKTVTLLACALTLFPKATLAQQQGTVSEVPTRPFTSTGFYLIEGQSVTVATTGKLNWFTDGCPTAGACITTPDGVSCPYTGFFAQGLPCWSLIGKVGQNGAPFEVGSLKTFTATSSGEFFLGVNDNNYPDNTGDWLSTISSPTPLI